MTRGTEIRTGSWAVESRCVAQQRNEAGRVHPQGQERGHGGDHDEEARRRKVTRGSRLVKRTATATMGPNSPIDPTARIVGPNDVFSTPSSRRIGSRVPSAVVVRHMPTTTASMTSPVAGRMAPTPRASRSEASHDVAARPRWPSRMLAEVELGAGQEHQVGQAEVGEGGDDGVRMRQRQHVGPEDDAQDDLDDDFGDGDEATHRSARSGARTAAMPMRSERGDGFGHCHSVSSRRVAARRGTPQPPPGHNARPDLVCQRQPVTSPFCSAG